MGTTKVHLDASYAPSEDIVSREIEGEILIVPLVSGIGSWDGYLAAFRWTEESGKYNSGSFYGV